MAYVYLVYVVIAFVFVVALVISPLFIWTHTRATSKKLDNIIMLLKK